MSPIFIPGQKTRKVVVTDKQATETTTVSAGLAGQGEREHQTTSTAAVTGERPVTTTPKTWSLTALGEPCGEVAIKKPPMEQREGIRRENVKKKVEQKQRDQAEQIARKITVWLSNNERNINLTKRPMAAKEWTIVYREIKLNKAFIEGMDCQGTHEQILEQLHEEVLKGNVTLKIDNEAGRQQRLQRTAKKATLSYR